MLVGVLHHHEGCVYHHSDRNGDSAEAHNVRVDSHHVHDRQRDEDANRDGNKCHERASDVKQE